MRPRFSRHPKRLALTPSLTMSAMILLCFSAAASRMAEEAEAAASASCAPGEVAASLALPPFEGAIAASEELPPMPDKAPSEEPADPVEEFMT